MSILSPKQQTEWRESDARWNVACGAASSGKTYCEYYKLPKRMLRLPPGNCLLIGKTERTYQRNILDPMRDMYGEEMISRVGANGTVTLFGRRCYLVGANDERSVTKIQGMTLVYANGDEFTTWPESFFQMLKSRLRAPGACCDLTANPEGPYHWGKKFIDDTPSLRYWHYTLDDNPFLEKAYVDAIKAEYTGMWYKRYILGLWVAAEGAIYDMFDEALHVAGKVPPGISILQHWIGVDYGTLNPTVFLLMGQGTDGVLYILDEWRYDSAEHGGRQKTDAQYSKDFKGWVSDHMIDPRWIFVDPSAASFRAQLRQDGVRHIAEASDVGQFNTVTDGLRRTGSLFGAQRLRILKHCKGLIREIQGYCWDSKAQERGEDEPLKVADHGPDALRYLVNGTHNTWRHWLGKAV